MSSRDFCYWLQGHFELSAAQGGLTQEQADKIKNHLAMVFVHEIDPAAGEAAHQAKLNDLHAPTSTTQLPKPLHPGTNFHDDVKMRC